MEFNDDHHNHHHDDQDDNDMEQEMIPTSTTAPPGYDASSRSTKMGPTSGAAKRVPALRYRECLKNHAVNIGSHALDGCGEFLDGCGEFLAAVEEGSLDALKCAACGCHRNFHRKEPAEGGGSDGVAAAAIALPHHSSQQPFSAFYRHPYPPPPPSGYLHLTAPQPQQRPALAALTAATAAGSGGSHSRDEMDDVSNPSSSGGGGGGSMGMMKKRFRTKFTAEQKEKMVEFAEKLGWRIQKHDEAAVEEFCADTGVRRQVLKVWMHNNKHTIGKKPYLAN